MVVLLTSLLMGLAVAIMMLVARRSNRSDQLPSPTDFLSDPTSDVDSWVPSSQTSPPPYPARLPHNYTFGTGPATSSWDASVPLGYPSSLVPPTPLSSSPNTCPGEPLFHDELPSSCFPLLQQTLAAFQLILQAFRRHSPALSGPRHADFLHDLSLILQEADLHAISLDLLDHQDNVLFRYRVDFAAPENAPLQDPAHGLELPLFPLTAIASHRLCLGPLARFHHYAHRLRFPWRSATPRNLLAPNRFTSKFLEVSSAFRLSASVFVTDLARRSGAIQQVAPSGSYAFASSPQLPAPVFLHRSECDLPLPFRIGQQVSFVLIHTPRGYQGRNIRPA